MNSNRGLIVSHYRMWKKMGFTYQVTMGKSLDHVRIQNVCDLSYFFCLRMDCEGRKIQILFKKYLMIWFEIALICFLFSYTLWGFFHRYLVRVSSCSTCSFILVGLLCSHCVFLRALRVVTGTHQLLLRCS